VKELIIDILLTFIMCTCTFIWGKFNGTDYIDAKIESGKAIYTKEDGPEYRCQQVKP
jgi:hypothetical protein